jgi:rhamnosyltransferase subunit B
MPAAAPHYLVTCGGTTGDIHPFMRIAHTLQAMGRQVTFITNTYHTRLLKGWGLPFVGLGTDEEYLRFIADPDIWHPQKGFAAILAQYQEQLMQIDAAIRAVVGSGPTVVIAHPFTVPAAAMARERGLVSRIASVYLAPSTIRTCHDPMRIGDISVPRWVPMAWRRALWRFTEKGWIDPVGLGHLNAVRSRLKLPPVTASFLSHIETAPDLTVTAFPAWFGPAMPDWPQPLLSADFQLYDAEPADRFSPELAAFLAAGEPPVVFTPGTGNVHASNFFACALAAVNQLGERAIFLTKSREQVPADLPAHVLWQPYVPLSGLLPRVKALVHHGGVGTTAEAMRAGTPQLVTYFAWDQFDNGTRVAELGMGQVMPVKRLSARKLARALRTVLSSDRMRDSGAQVARRFAQRQDPVELCAEIERRLLPPSTFSVAA